jgi:6,7-dimethyl-8-ribityllumazine synthase
VNESIHVAHVPGAYELPFAAQRLASGGRYDAVICLGCVIKGETAHDHHIAAWAAAGIGQVSLKTGVPVIFGVITPNNERQARARSKPGPLDRGKEVALTTLSLLEKIDKGEL